MQLLYSSPVASPEFAALSLLLSVDGSMTEPVLAVSTTSTVSKNTALEAVQELHAHVKSIIDATAKEAKGFAADLLREDEKSLRKMQIFRGQQQHGLGIHYRLMRGPESAKLQALVVAASGTKEEPNSEVLGVILSVGVAGMPLAHSSEPTVYSLQQRMSDCVGFILTRNADTASARTLMTTFLLSENDDYRISNERMKAPNLLVLPEVSDEKAKQGGVLSPMGMIAPITDFRLSNIRGAKGNMEGDDGPDVPEGMGFPVSLDVGSAAAARAMTDRLSVLSVAESHTQLRRYEHSGQERKANLDLTSVAQSRFRRRKADPKDADFDNFDYKGPAKEAVQRVAVKAIPPLQPTPEPPAGKPQLKSSRKDTTKIRGGRRGLGAHVGDQRKKSVKHHFDDEQSVDTRSHSGNPDSGSVMSVARIQVNIALNEDLTCSYKLSQLSSCNVEGVAQVC